MYKARGKFTYINICVRSVKKSRERSSREGTIRRKNKGADVSLMTVINHRPSHADRRVASIRIRVR